MVRIVALSIALLTFLSSSFELVHFILSRILAKLWCLVKQLAIFLTILPYLRCIAAEESRVELNKALLEGTFICLEHIS